MRSSWRPKHAKPSCIPTSCLGQFCLLFLACCELSQLHFVQGLSWDQQLAKRQVTLRFGQKSPNFKKRPSADGKARKLTTQITESQSAEELIDTLDSAIDDDIFNFIHASATYHKLTMLNRRTYLQHSHWRSSVLHRLHSKVEDLVSEDKLDSQATASVLWSLAKLSHNFSLPTQLLAELVESMPMRANGMDAQGLSNSLWAVGQLQDDVPEILEVLPDVAAQACHKAERMNARELSQNLWALAKFQECKPSALEHVDELVLEIPSKITGMTPFELSKTVEALGLLRACSVIRCVPREDAWETMLWMKNDYFGTMKDVMSSVAMRLKVLLPSLRGKDVHMTAPMVVWACARFDFYDVELLEFVSELLCSRKEISRLPAFSLCALLWSYEHFFESFIDLHLRPTDERCDDHDDHVGFWEQQSGYTNIILQTERNPQSFMALLESQCSRRGFSDADVQSSRWGRVEWNGAYDHLGRDEVIAVWMQD